MTGFWISFAIIAILIPIGIASFKTWAEKSVIKKPLSKEQKAHSNVVAFKLWMFYWLCDLFYMACFINNLVCKFVFGGLIMVIILMNVGLCFSSTRERTTFEKYGLLQDFLVGIGLTIYLIYIIPNQALQTIMIAIVSALYGGLITLVGVAWTIKKSDKDRKDDEIAKAKPYFSFVPLTSEPKAGTFEKTCFADPDDELNCKYEAYVKIQNSNQSVLIFNKIYHDGKWSSLNINQTLIPGDDLILSFRFTDFLHVFLEVNDILGNSYFYKVEMLGMPNPLNPHPTSSGLLFNTVRGFKEMSKEKMDKEILEANSK